MWRVSTVLELSGLSTAPVRMEPKHRERGTAVHSAFEAMSEGYQPATNNPEYEPYISGAKEWFEEYEPEIVANERRIINRFRRLTGKIDLVAILDGVPYVIDLKTGQEAPSHGIQTGGYYGLAVEDNELWEMMGRPFFGKLTELQRRMTLKRAILYLPGDGRKRWRVQNDPRDVYLFDAALSLMHFRHEHGLLSLTDPEDPDGDSRAVIIEAA